MKSSPCNILFATWDDKFGKIEGSCKQTTILNKFLLSLLFSHTIFSNLDKVMGCSVFDSVTKQAEATIRDIGKYENLDNRIFAFFVHHHKTKNEYSLNKENL